MTSPIWITPSGFLFTATELVSTSTTLVASGTNVTYKVLSGSLPDGLNLTTTTGIISGIPSIVSNLTTNKFVIRASNTSGVKDRTFSIDVDGIDVPIWKTFTLTTGTSFVLTTSTTEGYISVDAIKPYVFNKQYINYQLDASTKESPLSNISYYIDEFNGELPPNLTLSKSGNLSGIIDCFTDLDLNTVVSTATVYNPKTYQFYISATDGIAENKRLFKLLVVDSEMLKYHPLTTSTGIAILDVSLNSQPKNYLQLPQFIDGADLGTIRAENYQILNISTYDPSPFIGTITYSLVTGTTITSMLPQDLNLDRNNGIIYGYIPYQPAYTINYNLNISATKFDPLTGISVTASNTFTLAVKGLVESTIEWVSTSSFLGTITTGEISHLSVEAKQLISNYDIKYRKKSGTLPDGLTLFSDGSIVGKANTNSTGTFTFTAEAKDVYELSAIEKTFSIDVIQTSKEYTSLYFKPFLSKSSKDYYDNFINDEVIFDPKIIYRYLDPEFGVQRNIKINLEFAIEKVDIDKYTEALINNFYKRKFYFGNIKTAKAEDSNGKYIYDIVYADVIDNLVNTYNTSVSKIVYFDNNAYYPASIDNMRIQLSNIILDDSEKISINKSFYPKFLQTRQNSEYKSVNYIRFIPLCYTLPNEGQRILSRIRLKNFDFKKIHLDIDRIIIKENNIDNNERYLFFGKRDIKN